MQKFVEEAVPARVKTLFKKMIAVLTPVLMKIASVLVLAVAEVKAKAVLPILWEVVVLVVKAKRAAKVADGFVDVSTDKDSRAKIEVPPTTMP